MLAAWMEGLDVSSASRLKETLNGAVLRATMGDRAVVVKISRLSGVERVRSLLRATRAFAQWSGSERLAGAGIATARPLAIADDTVGGAQWLVMECAPGRPLIEVMALVDRGTSGAPGPAEQHAIARAVGSQIASISAAGLFNRDHKPSNLIVERGSGSGGGGPTVRVVDTVAIRRVRAGEWRFARRMMASLVIEPAGCGVRVRRGLCLRVLEAFVEAQGELTRESRRAALRGGWSSVAALVRAHGDPTPRDNPLGPSLSA